jgi:hypothetical protein
MKRLFTTLAITSVFLLYIAPQRANAITTVCINCSTLFQQIPEFIKGSITASQSTATAVNTFLLQMKATVLDPLQNAMIANTLLTQQSNTINLVTGALGGQQLLKSDPEGWIKNQGLNIIRLSINDLMNQNGTYSGTLLNSLISTYRGEADLESKIKTLSQSSLPSLVQNNLCGDTTLTSVATNDVLRADGTFDPAALTAKKQELYNQLCRGNPTTDKTLSNKLIQISEQRPDVGGIDTLLAIANEENAYARSVELAIATDKAKEDAEEAAREDLRQGGGIASATECKDTPGTTGQLNIANLPCRNQLVTSASAGLRSAFDQAINAPMQKLIAAEGSGILGTLSQLLASRNTVDLLKNAFGTNAGSGGNGGFTFTDIAATPEGKANVADPINDYLDRQSKSLDKLLAANQKLVTEAQRLEWIAYDLRACYQGLIDEKYQQENSPAVQQGFAFAAAKADAATQLRAWIAQDESRVTAARAEITSLRATLAASQSSSEIQSLFSQFEGKVSSGQFPNESEIVEKESKALEIEGDLRIEEAEGGSVYNMRTQCRNLQVRPTNWTPV